MSSILVIDDSHTVREEVRQTLESDGHDVIEAIDGREALTLLHASPDVRVAICDIHMPIMDGLAFLQHALKDGNERDLGVIMLTTSCKAQLIHQVRSAGARAWLSKPFKPEILSATVQALLKPREGVIP